MNSKLLISGAHERHGAAIRRGAVPAGLARGHGRRAAGRRRLGVRRRGAEEGPGGGDACFQIVVGRGEDALKSIKIELTQIC